jgi:signal peptidase I
MSVDRTTFEERLLPVLVAELSDRHAERSPTPAGSPRRARRRIAVLVVATAALVITVAVTSRAMEPTLREGANVSVDTAAYASSLPARSDVIAFHSEVSPGTVFLSRVIGLPGDTITESRGVVSVNGQVLDEPYATLDDRSGSWSVEPGHVFVMGDNRPLALDSRWNGAGAIGQVPVGDLVGRVIDAATSGPPDVPPGPASSLNLSGSPAT